MGDLKVLMMGGRRCGKTAALASLFYQATQGPIRKVFKTTDQTPPQIKDDEVLETLANKCRELTHAIDNYGNGVFLVDHAPSYHYWDYLLRMQIPGTDRKMEIQFRDCAGEIFESNINNDIVEYIKGCDVFIVVVDTPFLMKGGTDNECANRNIEIDAFLTHIAPGKAKQVLFVPVKCEKWVKENRVDEVSDAVEQLYHNTIADLLATPNVEVSIVPIETAGDIIFQEFREPFLLHYKDENNKEKNIKCSTVKGDDSVVLLEDGKPHRIKEGEYVIEDPQAVFTGTGIVRQATWFRLTHNPIARYTPHNCEQLVIHILRFMFNKRRCEFGFWDFLRAFLGGITMGDIENALQKLESLNLIKNKGEGIRILKSCFLPEEDCTKPAYNE